MYIINVLYLIIFAIGIAAKTHTFYFNATYVLASPDGVHERRVIGINNKWPVPTIRVKKNDRVQIYFKNLLDRNASLHFHGLFQKGSNAMDGPVMVTQCPVPPGQTFLYNFTVSDQSGTFWYHSHSGAQYSDGLRGMFIIEDDKELPFQYDEELTLSVSDWYHSESPQIMGKFLSRYNPTGAEPIPQNALFNDTRNVTLPVEPDTTYLLRIANMGVFISQYLFVENHRLTIVEIDGVLVEPKEVDSLYIAAAQRYTVLLHTKASTDENYRFVNVIDQEMLDILPEDLEIVSTNWLVYNGKKELPKPLHEKFESLVKSLNPVDDFNLAPIHKEPLLPDYDYQISIDFTMENLGDGVNYALFNGRSYLSPKVPALMTVLSSGEYANSQQIYGSNTNSFVLQHNEIVEIVLNNKDPGKHPFHMHGHIFQLISRSPEGKDPDNPIIYDPNNLNHTSFPEYPMTRDTVMVNPNGYIVIRFKADNPGVWLFHCHVDWHLEQGLAITLIEAPFEIQRSQEIPPDHFDSCKSLHIPCSGNAAGNQGNAKSDWFNLEGENLQPLPLPPGFTLKGYVAFGICTFFAIYGVYSICKYGMEDITTDNSELMIKKLYEVLEKYGAFDEDEEETMIALTSNGQRIA